MINFEWYAKYAKEYLQLVLDTYSKYSPPVFVNYYSNTPVEFDRASFAGYSSPSDVLSPNKYVKFVGIPVFFSEQSSHPVTSFDVKGVVEESSTFTVTMFASIGVKPKPDDHLTFPVFADTYSTSALYQVMNVEPMLALSGDPMTEKYQAYRLTLALDNNIVSTIEAKVVDSYFYVSKHQKFLPMDLAEIYLTLLDQARQIELFLMDTRDSITLLWYPYKLVDVFYLVNTLMRSPITTNSFVEAFDNDWRVSTSILDALCLKLPTGSTKIERVEGVLPCKGIVSRRWWNRQCYITTDSGSLDLIECLYGDSVTVVRGYVDTILQRYANNDSTLILENHSIPRIFNLGAYWSVNRSLLTPLPTFTNWFEAIYYYSVISRILEELVS